MLHTERIGIRLTKTDIDRLDKGRGKQSRSGYVRDLIRAATTDTYRGRPVDDIPLPDDEDIRYQRLSVVPDESDEPRFTVQDEVGDVVGVVEEPEPPATVAAQEEKHWHRFKKGAPTGKFHRGSVVYAYACSCGATKEE